MKNLKSPPPLPTKKYLSPLKRTTPFLQNIKNPIVKAMKNYENMRKNQYKKLVSISL